jgi:hypothetical protein
MKLFPSVLATSVLALSVLGGCAMNPHNETAAAPALKLTTESHNISVGTTTRLTAETMNVVGGSDIQWKVTPTVAKISPEGDHKTTALFSSNEPGMYIVKAFVNMGNGDWVSDTVDITVNGVDANGHPLDTK